MNDQTNICPVCGATLGETAGCEEIFGELMALEYADPAYWEVHALTVATYMVQHGKYSDEALAWVLRQMRAMLEDGLTGEQLRKIAAHEISKPSRGWKVTRRPGETPLPRIAWEMTIADVAQHTEEAADYRETVRSWARATLRQQPPSEPAA